MCAPPPVMVRIASAPHVCRAPQMTPPVSTSATARLTALLPNVPNGDHFLGVLLRFCVAADQPSACQPVARMRRDGRS